MQRVPKRVFVYYPRGLRTGGPEALHQLVSTLRSLGTDAYLTPMAGSQSNTRAPEYRHYDAPEASEIIDADDVAIVVPEVYLQGLRGLKRAQRLCWWLSIDNSPAFYWQRSRDRGRLRQAYRRLRASRIVREIREMERSGLQHMVQSHYAWAFLNSHLRIVSSLVSDYTVVDLASNSTSVTSSKDERVVISYQPAKGGELVSQLLDNRDLDVAWLPIVNMTPVEVASALRRSSIYLDLGSQPGKDRVPREAAIRGALTLVARRGSGAYAADVPIPLDHKISVGGDIAANALEVIAEVVPRIGLEVLRQDFYREVIRAERDTFIRQVKMLFQDGVTGLDLDIPGVDLPDTR
jgi:hypothetical protein